MDVVETVLGTASWLLGVGLIAVMAALPWLELLGRRARTRRGGPGAGPPPVGTTAALR